MTDPRTGIDLDRSFVDRPFNSHPLSQARRDWRGLIGIAFALIGVVGFVLTLGVVM